RTSAGDSKKFYTQRGCGGGVFAGPPPPVDEGHIVLSGGQAAICRRCTPHVAVAVQLEHERGAVRPRHDDPIELRATGKLDHRFDDAACGRETRLEHGCTFISSTVGG